MDRPLRLLVYDATCRGKPLRPGLTHSWIAGSVLYRALGRLDDGLAVTSWREALELLVRRGERNGIAEVQYWGHGKWGEARVGREIFDEQSLRGGHALAPLVDALRESFVPGAQVWFRTCETLGARKGHAFARAFTDRLGAAVAGHTYIIGPWQSGLHRLAPGEAPSWPVDEGLLVGTPDAPARARWSTPRAPNTISCLTGAIPPSFR